MHENRPSATARLVARGVAFVARDPRHPGLVSPEMASLTDALLCHGFPGEARVLASFSNPIVRWIAGWIERFSTPGIVLHYTLRKCRIEDAALEAIVDGFGQVIVLGAGLDTLALRLQRVHPKVRFIEIDHPATQSIKRGAIADGAIPEPGDNFALIAADLARTTVADALASAHGFRTDIDTFVVAEGLLMYLTQAQVGGLLDNLRGLLSGDTRLRLAFTSVGARADGSFGFDRQSRRVDAWLARRGEPFRWGIRPADLPHFLAAHSFRLREFASATDLRRRYLHETPTDGAANGDAVAIADQGR